jgi:hypothetical protein
MREGERPALQHPPGMLENELSETWMVSGLSGQDNSRRVNASHAGSVPVLTKREFYNKGGFVAFRCYNISTGCWDSCGWPLPASLQPPHSGSKCTFRPLSHRHSHFFSLSLHLWLAYLAPSHRLLWKLMQQHSSATRLGLTHVHMPYFPHLFTSCSSLSSTARTYKSITPGVCSIKDTQSGSRKRLNVDCQVIQIHMLFLIQGCNVTLLTQAKP